MPKTRVQGIVFGLLMSITMAYGMEVYNVALKEGGLSVMTNRVFLSALLEAAYMWIFVFLFSNLWGNRLGHRLAAALCRSQDNPFLHTLFISSCTVLIMCPTMSMVAAILFSVVLGGGQLESAARLLGGHSVEKFPHGPAVEPVRRRPLLPSDLPENLRPAVGLLLTSSICSKTPAHFLRNAPALLYYGRSGLELLRIGGNDMGRRVGAQFTRVDDQLKVGGIPPDLLGVIAVVVGTDFVRLADQLPGIPLHQFEQLHGPLDPELHAGPG